MSENLILSDPEIMGGTPCIKGTRLPVYSIAARLNGGETVADLIADYPYVSASQFEAAAEYAARVPFEEVADSRPWRRGKARVPAE